jgi:hypothetical protein
VSPTKEWSRKLRRKVPAQRTLAAQWLAWKSVIGRFFAGGFFLSLAARPAPVTHVAGAVAALLFGGIVLPCGWWLVPHNPAT